MKIKIEFEKGDGYSRKKAGLEFLKLHDYLILQRGFESVECWDNNNGGGGVYKKIKGGE